MAWSGPNPTAPETQIETVDGTTITSDSVTLTAGRLYLVGVGYYKNDNTANAAPTSVVCNGTQAFTLVDADGDCHFDAASISRRSLWVGYCVPSATVTGTIVATFAATYAELVLTLVEVASNFDPAATFPQVDKAIDADATGTSTTLTFGSAMTADSLVVAFIAYGNDANPAVTADAAYTELVTGLHSTASTIGEEVHYCTAPDTTMTFTYASGTQVGAVGIEIRFKPGGGKGSGGKGKGGNQPNPGEPPKKPLRTSLSKSWKWDRGWR